MKFSSVLIGFVIGFATYFVMLQCITPGESYQYKVICDKNAQIRMLEDKVKRLEGHMTSLERINERYNEIYRQMFQK